MNPQQNHIHFISIGGAAMHNLAIDLHLNGYFITGSDDEIYEPSRSRLEAHGLLPTQIGWFPEKIHEQLSCVILGMHARADNPELLKAQSLGIPVCSYPEFVYNQCLNKQRIVIAGSHGKTTTTAIILHVLKYHNRLFDYLVGAKIDGFDTMAHLSDEAPIVVIEGDEYLSSPIDRQPKFLHYHHHIALVTGIAWDHINVFPTFEEYVEQFERLADATPKAGFLIYDKTDSRLANIAQKERADITAIGYGIPAHTIKNGKTYLRTNKGQEVEIAVFGEHNLKNIAGAKVVLEKIGIEDDYFYEAIGSFMGAANRLEVIAEKDNTIIFRDFAHAPSKVLATQAAVKAQFPTRKLVACFELHTFSSLNKNFLSEYAHKLDAADISIVYYSPHTLEHKKLPSISPNEVMEAFKNPNLKVFTDKEALQDFLAQLNWQDSNLLLMSSGTFDQLNLEQLKQTIIQ
jgi:UDP-N-acetylmuramate: L-alanyl-gamma-D-glutamyl-meso-diaminopimelate ligase